MCSICKSAKKWKQFQFDSTKERETFTFTQNEKYTKACKAENNLWFDSRIDRETLSFTLREKYTKARKNENNLCFDSVMERVNTKKSAEKLKQLVV